MCKVLQLEIIAILLHRFILAARVQWSGEPSCQGRMRAAGPLTVGWLGCYRASGRCRGRSQLW